MQGRKIEISDADYDVRKPKKVMNCLCPSLIIIINKICFDFYECFILI